MDSQKQVAHKPVRCFYLCVWRVCFVGSLQRPPVQRRHQEWSLATGGLGWGGLLHRCGRVLSSALRPSLTHVHTHQHQEGTGGQTSPNPCSVCICSSSHPAHGFQDHDPDQSLSAAVRPAECCINPKHVSGFQTASDAAVMTLRSPRPEDRRCDSIIRFFTFTGARRVVSHHIRWLLRPRPSYWKKMSSSTVRGRLKSTVGAVNTI